MDPSVNNGQSLQVDESQPLKDAVLPQVASQTNVTLPAVSTNDLAATTVQAADQTTTTVQPSEQTIPANPLANVSSTKNSQSSPDVADDVDLIEKEWVNKAKAIIASTSNDPNVQSKEISKFKADYQNTRFGKDLKVSEK